jgi:uncharacterized protein
MIRPKLTSALGCAALCLSLTTIHAPRALAAEGQQPSQLTILGGVSGGNDYVKAAGLAKILGEQGVTTNVETGGTIANVIQLDRGVAELGISMDFVPPLARAGGAPFPEAIEDTRGILLFSKSFTHVLATEESGVTSIEELDGRSFATQPVGTGSQYAFASLLEAYGLTEDSLDLATGGQSYGANQIKDRNLIGMTATTAFPGGTISELCTSINIRFLEVDDAAFQKVKEINPGLVRVTLPAGTYAGQEEAVEGIGTGSILVASADMPEDEVYWITKTIVENLDALKEVHASLQGMTREKMVELGGVALHPGAERYYREIGVIE